jgi:hypothetical protein
VAEGESGVVAASVVVSEAEYPGKTTGVPWAINISDELVVDGGPYPGNVVETPGETETREEAAPDNPPESLAFL